MGFTGVTLSGNKGMKGIPLTRKNGFGERDISGFDANDIGALAVPVPSFDELSKTISKAFAFLLDLSAEEQTIASAREQDRAIVLQALCDLPGGRLIDAGLY